MNRSNVALLSVLVVGLAVCQAPGQTVFSEDFEGLISGGLNGQGGWARPKFLRQTFHEFAGHSLEKSTWALAYYQMQKAKGTRRCLARVARSRGMESWRSSAAMKLNVVPLSIVDKAWAKELDVQVAPVLKRQESMERYCIGALGYHLLA